MNVSLKKDVPAIMAPGVGPIGWTNSARRGDSSPLLAPARRAAACKAADTVDVPVLHRHRPRLLSRL